MLTFTGRPFDCLRRNQVVTLRHATLARNIISILSDGILTTKSQGRYKAVWLHEAGRSGWAAIHTVARHGGRVEDVVVIEVVVPKAWLRRHAGAVDDISHCVLDIKVQRFRRVIGFEVLSRSRIEGAA